MYDGIVVVLILVLLVVGLGWLLGVIGFFRAGAAKAGLREARLQIERLQAQVAALMPQAGAPGIVPLASTAFVAVPPVLAPAAPEPVPETVVEQAPDLAPVPELEPAMAVTAPISVRRPDFEELLTARWGVWLGAAALLLAGVFLVRYAVEAGWFGPAMRCATAAVLGAGLILGGERVRRRPVPNLPYVDFVPAALVAGGVAVLFGAAYGAGVLYELIPLLLGFVLMAGVSLAGMVLSLRFGQLVAAVGIVGAFVTPLLVQTEHPSIPGLFGYLLFVAAAALAVVRYSAWVWLGWATTVAGALWVAAVALGGDAGADAWAPALFVPALALLNLVLLPAAALEAPVGRRLAYVPVAALGLAGLLLAAIEPGMDTRAGVLLLAPVTLAVAPRRPWLAPLPFLAAALGGLVLVIWGLPRWYSTGEAVYADGRVLGVLPGAVLPEVLQPYLWTSVGLAGLFALAGLWGERRTVRPLPWAGMVAVVPVLVLALAYWRVRGVAGDAVWAGMALVLAAGLTAAAGAAMRDGGRQRAGIHAAGAVAAVSLGCAMLLSVQWLTVALALMVPALAVIEAAADLPALRRVAVAVAAVALVRLLLNWSVLGYVLGAPAVFNGRAVAYFVAIVAFAQGARVFRRRADDGLVRLLEGGAVAFGTALVGLEIRQWASDGAPGTWGLSFTEAALQVAALGVQAAASLWVSERAGRPTFGWAWRLQGMVALAGGTVLVLLNPAFGGDEVGTLPVLDALLPAYAVPAALAAWASGRAGVPGWARRGLAGYALVAAFAWVTLEVRHLFHPDAMGLGDAPVLDSELWAWSGAWMAMALALMGAGVARGQRELRLAGLGVMALVTAKVFLVDMGGLAGLWRVLSFLGLGLSLIALGRVYQRIGARRVDPDPVVP